MPMRVPMVMPMPDPDHGSAGARLAWRIARVMAVATTLAWGAALWVAIGDRPRPFASRFECGTDPVAFLRIGELLEGSSLRFIVQAHCANARYLTDDRIELRFGGIPVEIQTAQVTIGGTTYYKIVSVDGIGQ